MRLRLALVLLLLAASPARGIAGPIAEVLHVVDFEADQVTDAMGEEQRMGAAFDERVDVTLQDTFVYQASRDRAGGREMNIAVANARADAIDGVELGLQNDLVDRTLCR